MPTDSDLMKGHPAEEVAPAKDKSQSSPTPSTDTTPVAEERPQSVKPSPFTPIYLGGRKFNSTEELAQYTSRLEQEKAKLEAYRPIETPAQHESKLEDLLFEDPASAIKIIKEDTKKEIISQYQREKSNESLWNKFYTEHPDLKGNEDLVGVYQQRLWNDIADLPLDESMPKLAKAVRERIQSYRKVSGGVETLGSKGAVVATGGSNETPQVTQKVEVESFMSQLSKLRNRKKTGG